MKGREIGYTASASFGINLKNTVTPNQKLCGVRITACMVRGCMCGVTSWINHISAPGWDGLQLWHVDVNACQWWAMQHFCPYDLDRLPSIVPTSTPKSLSTNCYVGYCHVQDIPGHANAPIRQGLGIACFGFAGGLIEQCCVHDIQHSIPNTGVAGTTGIAFLGARNYTVRDCEVYKVRTNLDHCDGTAFECEPADTQAIWERCYAHDNDGPGFNMSSGTIRHCISVNNLKDANCRTAIGNLDGEVTQTNVTPRDNLRLYNCTIIATTPGKRAFSLVRPNDAQGQHYLINNILVCPSGATCVYGYSFEKLVGNVYYANGGTVSIVDKLNNQTYTSLASLRTAGYEKIGAINYGVFGDPALRGPGSAPTGGTLPWAPLSTLTYFDPTDTSPAINAGMDYSLLSITPASTDFRQRSNFRDGAYDAGAVERP